jgi:hypothetical protein
MIQVIDSDECAKHKCKLVRVAKEGFCVCPECPGGKRFLDILGRDEDQTNISALL